MAFFGLVIDNNLATKYELKNRKRINNLIYLCKSMKWYEEGIKGELLECLYCWKFQFSIIQHFNGRGTRESLPLNPRDWKRGSQCAVYIENTVIFAVIIWKSNIIRYLKRKDRVEHRSENLRLKPWSAIMILCPSIMHRRFQAEKNEDLMWFFSGWYSFWPYI